MLNFYNGKSVLITGHTGFKGSWLASWLSMLGAKVTGFALPPEHEPSLFNLLDLQNDITHIEGDIRNFDEINDVIQKQKPEIVFHLAAQALVKRSYDDPLTTLQTNVMGSANLLEALRNSPNTRALVYITSDKCYWNSEWVWGYRENDRLGGPDPYSASKACAEHVFLTYYLSFFKDRPNFACGSTRAGNVIGGGDRSPDRIVPDIVRAIEDNNPIILRNPHATRPWQHVLDPLHGYLVLGEKLYTDPETLSGEGWNFGPHLSSISTVEDLSRKFLASWEGHQTEIQIESNNTFYESNLLHLNIDKAVSLLKWNPIIDANQAIEKTALWYYKIAQGDDAKTLTTQQIKDFMDVASR